MIVIILIILSSLLYAGAFVCAAIDKKNAFNISIWLAWVAFLSQGAALAIRQIECGTVFATSYDLLETFVFAFVACVLFCRSFLGIKFLEFFSMLPISILTILPVFCPVFADALSDRAVSKIGSEAATMHGILAAFSYAAMGVLIAAILVKFWMFYFNRKIAKRINSASIAATATDSLSDVIATAVVLVALIAGQYTDCPIDGIAGIIVAIFIFKSGWGAVKATQAPLLGRPMSKELADAIDKLALEHENILGIHDLIYHDYGPGRAIVSFHAEVPADGNLMETHELIDHVEREIRDKFGIEAVIHMDPIVVDGDTEEVRELVEGVVKAIHPDATVHDLRIANWDKIRNVYFDAIVPYGMAITDAEISEKIKAAISEKSGLNAVVHIEHPFIES